MATRIFIIFCVSLLFCTSCKQQPQIELTPLSFSFDSVDFDLPYKGKGAFAVKSDGFLWNSGHLEIEMRNGLLIINGINYGDVISGDRVSISESGEVIVNDHKILPVNP